MTPNSIQPLRDALKAGKIPAGDKSLQYEFRRGWNEGIEYAQMQIDKIYGKEETKE
jgi:hypothetical protein